MITLNGTTGITNDGGYTGDGVVFADTTPANTLVTTTGGNVGIGASSPVGKLDVKTASDSKLVVHDGNTAGNVRLSVVNNAFSAYKDLELNSNAIQIWTAGGERARIDTSGNLLMGTTSGILATSRATFKADSGAGIVSATNTDVNLFCINTNNTSWTAVSFRYFTTSQVGSIACTSTATSYVTSSDYRLKDNIAPMTGALAKVALLKPCTYNWKVDGSDGQGFIAHELQEVCPQAVTGEKDAVDAEGNPQYQGIDTSFLVATLTAAIQEQQAIITAQAAQIQQLREKVLEVEEGASNMLVENTNNLYETITALTARVAALESQP